MKAFTDDAQERRPQWWRQESLFTFLTHRNTISYYSEILSPTNAGGKAKILIDTSTLSKDSRKWNFSCMDKCRSTCHSKLVRCLPSDSASPLLGTTCTRKRIFTDGFYIVKENQIRTITLSKWLLRSGENYWKF